MSATTIIHDTYDAQLSRYAQALAAGRIAPVLPDLVDGSGPADVQRYVDNAVGERVRMLVEDAGLVGLVYDDLEAQAIDYVGQTPRGAYEFGRRETPLFLNWLRGAAVLTSQQADFVSYQLAEFACLELAHDERPAYLRFVAASARQSFIRRGTYTITAPMLLVNPVRVWSRLCAASANGALRKPRPTLFFAQREQIQHAAFDPRVAGYLQQLEQLAPCSPSVWARACGLSAVDAARRVATWIEQGIVAVTEKNFG